MKRTFFSGLFRGWNILPTLFGFGVFVIGSVTYLRAADGVSSREGGGFMAVMGFLILFFMVFNAWQKKDA